MLKRNFNQHEDTSEFENLVNVTPIVQDGADEDEEADLKKAKRKVIMLGVALGCVLALFLGFKLSLQSVNNVEKEKEAYKQTQIVEPHTSLNYYLTQEVNADTLQAAGVLVAHVMESGCSESYNALLNMFPDSSLEQLYSYLKGKKCYEYISPNIVRIKETDKYYEFLIKLERNGKDFILRLNHDNFVPLEFTLSPFEG